MATHLAASCSDIGASCCFNPYGIDARAGLRTCPNVVQVFQPARQPALLGRFADRIITNCGKNRVAALHQPHLDLTSVDELMHTRFGLAVSSFFRHSEL